MTRVRDLHKKWMEDPEYRTEYEQLEPEFELAQALIEARTRAGLTQAQLAKRMKTTRSVLSSSKLAAHGPQQRPWSVTLRPPAHA